MFVLVSRNAFVVRDLYLPALWKSSLLTSMINGSASGFTFMLALIHFLVVSVGSKSGGPTEIRFS